MTPDPIVCDQQEWFFGLTGTEWEFTVIDASYSSNLVAVGAKSTVTDSALLLVRNMATFELKFEVVGDITIGPHTVTSFDVKHLQFSPSNDLIAIP